MAFLVYILNRHSILVFITDESSRNLQDWNICFTKTCFAICMPYFLGPFYQTLKKSVELFHFSAAEALHKSIDAPGVSWKLALFLGWFKLITDPHCSQMPSPGCKFQVLSFLAETTLQFPVILTMLSGSEKDFVQLRKVELGDIFAFHPHHLCLNTHWPKKRQTLLSKFFPLYRNI